jgi:hypothetical protein
VAAIDAQSPSAVQGLSEADKANLQAIIGMSYSPISSNLKAALEDMLALANTPISSIAVTGSLDFGDVGIEQLYKGTPVESTSAITMTGTLGQDQHITVTASQWASGNVSFTPQLALEVTGKAGNLTVDSSVNLTTGAPVTVAPAGDDADATADGPLDFSLTVSKATLTGLPVSLGAGRYSGSLTWNLVTGP